MKNFLVIFVSFLFIVSASVIPSSGRAPEAAAASASREYVVIPDLDSIDNPPDDRYVYPITPDSEDWAYMSVLSKVEMLKIPQNVLDAMSDEQLIQAIADYPYLVDIYVYGSSAAEGIETASGYFSALKELLSRDSAKESLLSGGVELACAYLASGYAADADGAADHRVFVSGALMDIVNYVNGDGRISIELIEPASAAAVTVKTQAASVSGK